MINFKEGDKVKVTDKLWNSACPNPDLYIGKTGKIINRDAYMSLWVVKLDESGHILKLKDAEMRLLE